MNILFKKPHKKTFIIFLSGILLFSCQEKIPKKSRESRQKIMEELKEAETYAKGLTSPEERCLYWKKLLAENPFSGDSVATAKIHYRLAGTYYYKGDLDSIKRHMQKAWGFMQKQKHSPGVVALLNYGEGNIARMESNVHQENYYFNLASQAIVSNSSIDLTPIQKASIFMATAQSDARLYQYQQAMDWNRKAIALLHPDTIVNPRLLHRAYQQLATNFLNASRGNTDSVFIYINKVEKLVKQYPNKIPPRFLYDSKAHYFDRMGQSDSALIYHHKILKMDKTSLAAGMTNPTQYSNMFRDYINLSNTYLQGKEKDSAHYYIEKGTAFVQEHGQYLTKPDYVLYREALVNYFFITGQYEKAFDEYSTLMEEQKTIYENEYAQSIAEMSTTYKLQANEKAIMELNRQVILTESRLSRNRLLLIITTLSALLAIAIVILLYSRKKQRQLKEEKERVQIQKSAMELEQRLLRTQMEPHFIFNTLSALQSYIRLEKKEKALRYLKQFSRLLRNSMELSRESIVPLEEEIDTLDYYLGLQQMRYDESFDYQIHRPVQDGAYQVLIPPMIIQPFVENAILHGVANMKGQGKIVVTMQMKEETLLVTITDNGPGIKTVKQKPDGKKKSLSTAISRERLDILSREKGVNVKVSITDRRELTGNNRGTQVELIIPVEKDF